MNHIPNIQRQQIIRSDHGYLLYRVLLLIGLTFPKCILAQNVNPVSEIKPDTSYTIYSTYHKLIKNYPFISIADYTPYNKILIQKEIPFRRYKNRIMHLDLYRPVAAIDVKMPCVLLIHGGGWNSGNKNMMQTFALALADRNYVTMAVEYRLSNEARYPAAAVDIHNAVKWIFVNADSLRVDTARIALMGFSAGGQLAALIGTTFSTGLFSDSLFYPYLVPKIFAIIDVDGVLAFIHPLSEEGKAKHKPGAAEKWLGVHYSMDSTNWIQASPLTHTNKNTPPTLFVASDFPRFNAGRQNMIEILNKYKIYHQTIKFNRAPHSFWHFNPWFGPLPDMIDDFLKGIKTNLR